MQQTKAKFKDHFSDQSSEYRQYRPQYPPALFAYLASISAQQELAWDCATGSGQSALGLSEYFPNVIASDASHAQIKNAIAAEGIQYIVASAENSKIAAASVDLITVAQALHWFNIDAFGKEANRVLKENGILVVWTYNLFSVNEQVDALIGHLYNNIISGFWPPERTMVENAYQDISLPLKVLKAPEFNMAETWSLSQLIGFMQTWSATKGYTKQHGLCPLLSIQAELKEAWGMTQSAHEVNWPLSVRVWQKSTT